MTALFSIAGASAQEVTKPISQWPRAGAFPNEDKAAAIEYFRKVRAYAVSDPHPLLTQQHRRRQPQTPEQVARTEAE